MPPLSDIHHIMMQMCDKYIVIRELFCIPKLIVSYGFSFIIILCSNWYGCFITGSEAKQVLW